MALWYRFVWIGDLIGQKLVQGIFITSITPGYLFVWALHVLNEVIAQAKTFSPLFFCGGHFWSVLFSAEFREYFRGDNFMFSAELRDDIFTAEDFLRPEKKVLLKYEFSPFTPRSKSHVLFLKQQPTLSHSDSTRMALTDHTYHSVLPSILPESALLVSRLKLTPTEVSQFPTFLPDGCSLFSVVIFRLLGARTMGATVSKSAESSGTQEGPAPDQPAEQQQQQQQQQQVQPAVTSNSHPLHPGVTRFQKVDLTHILNYQPMRTHRRHRSSTSYEVSPDGLWKISNSSFTGSHTWTNRYLLSALTPASSSSSSSFSSSSSSSTTTTTTTTTTKTNAVATTAICVAEHEDMGFGLRGQTIQFDNNSNLVVCDDDLDTKSTYQLLCGVCLTEEVTMALSLNKVSDGPQLPVELSRLVVSYLSFWLPCEDSPPKSSGGLASDDTLVMHRDFSDVLSFLPLLGTQRNADPVENF
eukprot:g35491.t1